jgi:hypothetical protein
MLTINPRKNTELSLREKRQKLGESTNDYISGKISNKQFRLAEQEYMTDYNAFVREMGKVRIAIRNICHRVVIALSKK